MERGEQTMGGVEDTASVPLYAEGGGEQKGG